MRYLIIIFCSLLIITSCSFKREQKITELNIEKKKYKLVEIDSYNFRRAYHGHDELEGKELELFMNRAPTSYEDYTNSNNHPLYKNLSKIGIFQNGNLNIKELDTLPDKFNYQISQNNILNVETKYLEDPKEVDSPSYELTFIKDNKIILCDTLKFDWPPDITFIKTDIDKNGTEELISIFRWYIVNGDNYDLKIYELKE